MRIVTYAGKMDFKFLIVFTFLICSGSCDLLNTVKKKTIKLPPCEVCKKLVKSFEKGIEKTSRSNFAGGDTAWEEEKLGSYYRSEVRLVEIQEQLCLDVEDSEAQCHSLAEDAESYLEDWWFKKQDTYPNLEKWLCITSLKLCCEPGLYGPKCEECPGYPNELCSGHGKCKGSGTRTGTGQCKCDAGYSGKFCEHCAANYFAHQDQNNKVSCSPCHTSCQTGCSDDTPKGCKDCKAGWKMNDDVGCVDIDECKIFKNVCKSNNEVCINTVGSYACQGKSLHGLKDPGKWVRYVTYVGFLIATVVFLRKSLMLGGAVGVVAALYVSASEMLMSDRIDVNNLDFKSWLGTS